MGVNWNPRFGYIPKIALPTVFGDALSYMEMIGRYNAELNHAIDNINALAKNIEATVQESVKDAKIPIYGVLLNNGSNIFSPSKWYLSDDETIYAAINEGKLCILYSHVAFNEGGRPVVSVEDTMYFILTQVVPYTDGRGLPGIAATFMSYDEKSVRYVRITFVKNRNTIESVVTDIRELLFPTEETFVAVDNLFKKCVFVYKGESRVPPNSGQYIELTANGTEEDLSQHFVVQTGGTMYADECAPAVCVDYVNGNVGELRYGGANTPWVRIYSYGIQLRSDLAQNFADIAAGVERMGEKIDDNAENVGIALERIQQVQDDSDNLSDAVSELSANSVSYLAQNKTLSEKLRARANIGAVGTQDPVFTGELTLQSGYGSAITFTVTTSQDIVALNFYPQRVQIDGVIDPTSAQQVATKNYVDRVVGDTNGVLYTEQEKTSAEKATARNNIGAPSAFDPVLTGTLTLNDVYGVQSLTVSFDTTPGRKAIALGGSSGSTMVRNVGDPVAETDAANKRYVDEKVVESAGNVKYSVAQSLSDSDKERARKNIGAVGHVDADFYREIDLDAMDEEESARVKMSNANITRNLLLDNSGLKVTNEDDELAPIHVRTTGNDDDAVSYRFMMNWLEPYRIVVNAATNSWTATHLGTSVSDIGAIINAFYNGIVVNVAYDTVGAAGVAYARPLYVGMDIGIVCETFDGYQRKRLTLNANGTVTMVVLETVTP